ncbi:aminoglycoside phosphotransferase family protein [Exiguobacterium sp. s28]|uniref:aminoglycoside phosphotransferase family protein n=1 Tax=Exiguobacterium sp. s28 TaxID=2751238 RepID=UPI001BECA489|nr:aminoglycoside phosphotransferase family protein [Exiguobacterium sp. s28]
MLKLARDEEFFKDLCRLSRLGELRSRPTAVSGGLLHDMYQIDTDSGTYAIKLLNPQIMKRPEALHNFINSERIANLAMKRLPALAAHIVDGESIQTIDGQFYLVFDWVDGTSLPPHEIQPFHCERIGDILATLHSLEDTKVLVSDEAVVEEKEIDWDFYVQKGNEQQAEWAKRLRNTIEDLYTWHRQAVKSSSLFTTNRVISHRDLDSKNVLWHDDRPLVIDWESAGSIHPMQDLMETALYWSLDEAGVVNRTNFFSSIQAYEQKRGRSDVDWQRVLWYGYLGKLKWLEYNLKRSLHIESASSADRATGTSQVAVTLEDLHTYAAQIPRLLTWLRQET